MFETQRFNLNKIADHHISRVLTDPNLQSPANIDRISMLVIALFAREQRKGTTDFMLFLMFSLMTLNEIREGNLLND